MRRRTFLGETGLALSATIAGCLGETGPDAGGRAGTGDENDNETEAESRAKACEEQYIRTEVVTRDDEEVNEPVQPTVIDSESRDDGEFVALRTEFGVTRESEEEPDEHLDYLVAASYLITNETVYRTEREATEDDPRDGIQMNC